MTKHLKGQHLMDVETAAAGEITIICSKKMALDATIFCGGYWAKLKLL